MRPAAGVQVANRSRVITCVCLKTSPRELIFEESSVRFGHEYERAT
jgi:hypothetical protein